MNTVWTEVVSKAMTWPFKNTYGMMGLKVSAGIVDQLRRADLSNCICVNGTDLCWCWLECACGGRARWTPHSLRPECCSLAQPSCSHVPLRPRHTGYPEAGSRGLLMGHCQIYHSGGGRGHRIDISDIYW